MQSLAPVPKRKLGADLCSNCLRHFAPPQKPSSARRPGLQNRPRRARSLHTAHPLLLQERQEQAQPLGDYYESLLSSPAPMRSAAAASLPTFVPSGDLSKEQRAAKLFGSVEGSGYQHSVAPRDTWHTVDGVAIPPRPTEPDNCCMSGCVHCVWDDYRDDVEGWAGRVREAQAKRAHGQGEEKRGPHTERQRGEVQDAAGSMDDDGGGSEALWDAPSVPGKSDVGDELFQGIPVGIREFMATEKRIRERKGARARRKS